MIDKNKLFSIFEKGDEEIYEEHGLSEVLLNPFVLLNMTVRGIENFQLMNLMYSRNYPEEYSKVKLAIKYRYYSRLYSYLAKIKLEDTEDTFTIGDSYNVESTFLALEDLKGYFEELEEFEKCALLKKYLNFLLEKLVP